MSKILISFKSELKDEEGLVAGPFYESLIKSLARNGNEVVYFISNDFVNSNNKSYNFININKLKKTIRNFNPDLIVAFNNNTLDDIGLVTECPIVLWDADSVRFFAQKEKIKTNVDRYYFLCFSKTGTQNPELFFNAKKNKIYYMPPATDMHPEAVPQDKNISFIGTMFKNNRKIYRYLVGCLYDKEKKGKVRNFLQEIKNDYFQQREHLLEKYDLKKDIFLTSIKDEDLFSVYAGEYRIKILNSLVDLGLTIYGSESWRKIMKYSVDLGLSFDSENIYSFKQNQYIYNSSKISISIAHPQASTGFPWRTMDIMATNSCLVSESKKDLMELYNKYVSIPTYETPEQARQACIRLLRDDALRQDLVYRSQQAIEINSRFEHRLKDMEQIFSINLFNESGGYIKRLHYKDFVYSPLLPYVGILAKVRRSVKLYKRLEQILEYAIS